MSQVSSYLLFLGVFASLQCFTIGLKCYECSMFETDLCIENPVIKKSCKKQYCTVFREERMIDGKITNFSRSCEEQYTDSIIILPSIQLTKYYTSCETDLCNNGSGKADSLTTVSPILVAPELRSHANTSFRISSIIILSISILPFILLYAY